MSQPGQWAADAVKGCAGPILKLTRDKVTIRNAATNRKKTFDRFNAFAVPPVGSFLMALTGKWYKIMVTEGREAVIALVLVFPSMLDEQQEKSPEVEKDGQETGPQK